MDNLYMGQFSIGQTLDRGIRLYKQTIGKFLLLIGLPFLLGLTNIKAFLAPDPAHPFAVFNGLYIISMITSCWAWIVAIRYVYKKSMGEDPSFTEIIRFASPVDLLFIFTFFIWYIALFLGTIALVIPGIYLINIFMVGMVVIIVEKKYFFNGIGRTFKLTKGRWWKTFVINLVSFLIIGTPLFIGTSLSMGSLLKQTSVSQEMVTAGNVLPEISLIAIVCAIAYMAIIAIIYPLVVSINVVHYNSLRSEKEHTDLSRQLDTLQTGSPVGA